MERLPLLSVRVFTVVAKLSSVTRAAEELNVSPSAVSHQLKVLEDYLSVQLFKREHNQLTLTPAGQQYLSEVSEGLLLIGHATDSIRKRNEQSSLRIAAPPSFASLWLVDRVSRFNKANPSAAVTLTATADPVPLAKGAFDAAFLFGNGMISGLIVDPLGPNSIFPICKPSLMKGDHALRDVAGLARCTLIDSLDDAYYEYGQPRQTGWLGWLRAAGMPEVTAKSRLNLTPRLLMHQAVLRGHGVGLSRTLLAVDSLATKELAVPFGPVLPQTLTYHLVLPPAAAKRKDLSAFREWVLAEAQASNMKLGKLLKRAAAVPPATV